MRIHIVGAGPVGQLLATLLIETGHNVTIITRSEAGEPFKLITRINIDGSKNHFQIPVCTWNNVKTETIQFAVICTKAQDALGAFNQLTRVICQPNQVLFLNNGMGPQQDAFGIDPDSVLWGSNTHGCYFDEDNQLIHAGAGQLLIGSQKLSKPSMEIPTIFSWQKDIESVLWNKLAVNALINPLTVIYQCKNGDLLKNSDALKLFSLLSNEVVLVAQSQGIQLQYPESQAIEIAKMTANNWSSSMQDVHAHRDTELDFINGFLIRAAKLANLPVPTLKRVMADAKQLV